MKKPIHTISHEKYIAVVHQDESQDIDRIHKFERYPLIQLEETLRDPLWEGHEVNYYEIGANVGMSVVLAGKMLLGRGSVYSFEVEPTNYMRLVDNIMLNELPNTTALPFGIGDRCELAPFFINERHLVEDRPKVGEGLHSFRTYETMDDWHSKKHSFQACMYPLDRIVKDFELPMPTHVFIDAFGMEFEIIDGMMTAIKNGGVNYLMVQIEQVGNFEKEESFRLEANATFQKLTALHYELRSAEPLPGILDLIRGYNCVFQRLPQQ